MSVEVFSTKMLAKLMSETTAIIPHESQNRLLHEIDFARPHQFPQTYLSSHPPPSFLCAKLIPVN